MVKTEFSWKANNYWSMSRFSDTVLKLSLLAALAAFKSRYTYEEHAVMHLVGIGLVGFVIASRFFLFIQYHRQIMNYMEIIKGLILLLIATLCGLHEASGGNLYVPLCLLMIFPFTAASIYLAHN
jgi:hypothetical protein